MVILPAILVAAASLFSFSFTTSTATPTICSAISNPDCQCLTSPPSPPTLPDVRCTFKTSSSSSFPSPLFLNASFARSVQLGTLDLSRNNLDRLPDDFFQQESVEALSLKDNRLGEVPAVLRKLRSLKTLDLSNNAVKSLGLEVLGAVAGLHEVDMSGNQLTSLSEEDGRRGEIGDLRNLKILLLASNRITSLDNGTLSRLSGLIGLDLSHNRLSDLSPSTLRPLRRSLQALVLTNNSLTPRLHPLAFRPLERLRALSLAHNEVRGVAGQLWLPQHLSVLDLHHCGLTSVRRCRLAYLRDLTELDLRENALECTCDLFFLQQSLQNSDPDQKSIDKIQWDCQDRSSTAAANTPSRLIAVARLAEQCKDSYADCPSESELVHQMAVTIGVQESQDSLLVSWTLRADDDLRLEGFHVRYIPQSGDPIQSDMVALGQRRLALATPGLDEHFVVCVDVLVSPFAVVHQECRGFYKISRYSQIVGILAGVIFLAPCIVILLYIVIKDKKIRGT